MTRQLPMSKTGLWPMISPEIKRIKDYAVGRGLKCLEMQDFIRNVF